MADEKPERLWHYTTRAAARAILEEGAIRVGTGSHYGEHLGVYATDLPPTEHTPDELAPLLFDGDADAVDRAQAVVEVASSWYGDGFAAIETEPGMYKVDGHYGEDVGAPVFDGWEWDGADWVPLPVY